MNTVTEVGAGGVSKLTPDLGGPTAVPAAMLVTGHATGDTLTVDFRHDRRHVDPAARRRTGGPGRRGSRPPVAVRHGALR